MTNRHSGYLIVLDDDIREDDAEATIAALRMVKGVQSVGPIVAGQTGLEALIASSRRDVEWREKLMRAFDEMRPR